MCCAPPAPSWSRSTSRIPRRTTRSPTPSSSPRQRPSMPSGCGRARTTTRRSSSSASPSASAFRRRRYIEALSVRGRLLAEFLETVFPGIDALYTPMLVQPPPTMEAVEAALAEKADLTFDLARNTRLFNYLGLPGVERAMRLRQRRPADRLPARGQAVRRAAALQPRPRVPVGDRSPPQGAAGGVSAAPRQNLLRRARRILSMHGVYDVAPGSHKVRALGPSGTAGDGPCAPAMTTRRG